MNTNFLGSYNLTGPQRRTALHLLKKVDSATVRHSIKWQGLLTATIRDSNSLFEWQEIQIDLDGRRLVIDEKIREVSVFDDREDPEEIVYPEDPFDPQNWDEVDEAVQEMPVWDEDPETATDLVVIDEETGEILDVDPVLDILLNSSATMASRVTVLANVCAGAVRKGLEGGDLSSDLLEAEVLRGTLGKLAEIRGVANVAELQVAMKMDAIDTRYLMPDGGSADLAEELRRAMPVGNASAGRAHQIARFLTEGSRILLTAGVKPEEISAILQDGKLSKLAVVSSAVKRVHEDVSLNTESRLIEYRQILSDATNMAARKLQRKYGRHRFSPAPAYLQRDGTRLRVVMWPSVDQWTDQLSPRLGNVLDFESGESDDALTPDYVLNHDLTKIFQAAVESSVSRRAVLGVMSHASGQPLTRRYIASILVEMSEQQVQNVLIDLLRWSLVAESKVGNQTVYELNRKETE